MASVFDRDFHTEALGFAAHALGWRANDIVVQHIENAPYSMLRCPATSRYGLWVDLREPFSPQALMFPCEDANEEELLMALQDGNVTEASIFQAVREVNKGRRSGPVLL